MFCRKCGKKLDIDAKFCDSCGIAVVGNVNNRGVLSNSTIVKSKGFNFWRVYAYITIGILILLTIFFGFLDSYGEEFFGPFIGIVILSGLLGILGTFIIKWYKRGFVFENMKKNLDEKDISRYKGLKGWLIFVAIGLFANVVMEVYSFYDSIMLFKDKTIELLIDSSFNTYVPGFATLLRLEMAGGILFLAFAIYLILLFFQKNKKFPKYYIIFLVSSSIFIIIDYLLLSSLQIDSIEVRQIIDEAISEQVPEIARDILTTIIWVSYMLKSKRVKATFIEE